MSLKKVVVECDPDEILAMALGIPRKLIAHQSCKGEVCNYVKKNESPFAIVDQDPGSAQPNYMAEFNIKEEHSRVEKRVHPNKPITIFVLKPRLEEWIIFQCNEVDVIPDKFSFPNDPKAFKKVVNQKLDALKKLIDALVAANSPGLIYLKKELAGFGVNL